MSANTANGVISYQGTACKKQARREESTKRIDSVFLNGPRFIGKQQDVEKARVCGARFTEQRLAKAVECVKGNLCMLKRT